LHVDGLSEVGCDPTPSPLPHHLSPEIEAILDIIHGEGRVGENIHTISTKDHILYS
jgi:hypothetical protein